jgi:nucleoside-diphosphate-sugar epimerase
MRGPIVVTGAAGRLGQELCRQLAAMKADVRAADRAVARDSSLPVQTLDMLDCKAVQRFIEGAWAVVHLANYTHASAAEARRLFNENVSMNMNVFHSAHEAGAPVVVFASSIQVVCGSRTLATAATPSCLSYLPLDSHVPPNAGNAYALSKHVGEVMLRYYIDKTPVASGTCIRFPMLVSDSDFLNHTSKSREPEAWQVLDQAFALLRYVDAARLIGTIAKRPQPGFRTYLPAARQNVLGQSPASVIRRFYPNVPLRQPLEEMDSLVDISQISAETGWEPTGPKEAAAVR